MKTIAIILLCIFGAALFCVAAYVAMDIWTVARL